MMSSDAVIYISDMVSQLVHSVLALGSTSSSFLSPVTHGKVWSKSNKWKIPEINKS